LGRYSRGGTHFTWEKAVQNHYLTKKVWSDARGGEGKVGEGHSSFAEKNRKLRDNRGGLAETPQKETEDIHHKGEKTNWEDRLGFRRKKSSKKTSYEQKGHSERAKKIETMVSNKRKRE